MVSAVIQSIVFIVVTDAILQKNINYSANLAWKKGNTLAFHCLINLRVNCSMESPVPPLSSQNPVCSQRRQHAWASTLSFCAMIRATLIVFWLSDFNLRRATSITLSYLRSASTARRTTLSARESVEGSLASSTSVIVTGYIGCSSVPRDDQPSWWWSTSEMKPSIIWYRRLKVMYPNPLMHWRVPGTLVLSKF